MSLLELRKLNKHFGGLHVTNAVDLTLEAGEIHCLIGPNGAGKSTLFRLILGEHHPGSGDVLFAEKTSRRSSPLRGFAADCRSNSRFLESSRAYPSARTLKIALQSRHRGRELEAEIDRLLVFLGLESEQAQTAGNLSHGQKQWLEIGMAISLKPSFCCWTSRPPACLRKKPT